MFSAHVLLLISSNYLLTSCATIPAFTETDLQCLSNGTARYPHDNKCYNILERGPCSPKEWLVLQGVRGRLEAVCEQCPCCKEAVKKVFWTPDGQCHRITDKLCPKGNKLVNDFDGRGVCVCKDGYAKVANRGSEECFPLFERSTVCPQGQYLTLRDPKSDDTLGQCSSNPCQADGMAPWTHEGHHTNTTRHCYRINTQGPCPEPDQMFRVMPSDPNLVGCFSPAFSSFGSVPTLCNRSSGGSCKPPVTFTSNSGKPSMSPKLQAFLNRKRIGSEDSPAVTPATTPHDNYGPTSEMWAWHD